MAFSSATPAQALTATIDVQQLTLGGTQSALTMAQTFTADRTASLVRVSLPFWTRFGMVSLGVQGVDSTGAPDGVYKAQPQFWTGFQACCDLFNNFDLTNPVAMTKGSQYAIVVSLFAGSFNWYYTAQAPPNFSGGKLFVSACDAGCTWLSGGIHGADFGFETWVPGGAAQPLTVSADNAAVRANEGTAPSNTGTYSGPDGVTVSLKASSGSLTRTGASSGTWSWTGASAEETSAQLVTITADDGNGHTTTATFTATVVGAMPAAKITSDPLTVPEGKPETFTGTASTTDAADQADGLAETWSVTKNGSPYAQGTGTTFSFTPDDEGTFVVTFAAADDGGATGIDTMTLTGTNVAPTAKITGVAGSSPLVILPNEAVNFSGSFSDPGTLDTHDVTWSFGDGATFTTSYGQGGSANLSASHRYASAGTYTVSLKVTDDDGGVSQTTTTVTVESTPQALASIESYVRGLPLNNGEKQSLLAKLDAASAAASRGDDNASGNQLNACLNELDAMVQTGRLTTAQAAPIRGAIHDIQGTFGTYNRFLEWWPLEA